MSIPIQQSQRIYRKFFRYTLFEIVQTTVFDAYYPTANLVADYYSSHTRSLITHFTSAVARLLERTLALRLTILLADSPTVILRHFLNRFSKLYIAVFTPLLIQLSHCPQPDHFLHFLATLYSRILYRVFLLARHQFFVLPHHFSNWSLQCEFITFLVQHSRFHHGRRQPQFFSSRTIR